jgi:serine/threonine protein phosphatase PrpC
MSIAPVAASVSQAKRGSESFKAHTLSQQFQNLCRGESFAKEQMAKWKHPETGLKKDDLMIVESLAYRAMKYFGYEAAHVKEPCDVLQFTEAQLEEFALLNKDGVEEMYEKLKKENVADYNRRVHQAEVLKMGAKRLSTRWSIDESFKAEMKKNAILEQLNNSAIVEGSTDRGILAGFGTFVCGASSQKGYYPATPMKENQDSFDIRIANNTQKNHFFGVFDGHGDDGGLCSQLCKTSIGDIYEEQLSEGHTTKVSLTKAHTETHDIMTKSAAINAELSGSTTVIASLKGNALTIAYAGDSAAIIGSKSNKRTPMLLTKPHDLSRPGEVARIERMGGLVMSTEEYDEIKEHMTRKRSSIRQAGSTPKSSVSQPTLDDSYRPTLDDSYRPTLDGSRRSSHRPTLDDSYYFHQSLSDLMKFSESPRSRSSLKSKDTTSDDSLNQSLRKAITRASTHSLITVKSGSDDDENYVPRIWSGTSVEKVPGVAFTRSLGDVVAHEIGVSEEPDFQQMTVQDDDVIVIASDGVTEYLDADTIIKIVNEIDDPAEAARKLVKTSAALWAEKNDYCDDITAVVIFISSGDDEVGSSGKVGRKQVKSKSKDSMFHRLLRRRGGKQFPLLFRPVSSSRFVQRKKKQNE